MSTHLPFFWYPLCVAGKVSSCRAFSWVSIGVKASYLLLAVMLEDEAESCCFGSPGSKVSLSQWCLLTGTSFWKQIPISVLTPLVLHSLMTVSCNSATSCNRSSACAHLLQVLTFISGEGPRHSLQPMTCTALVRVWSMFCHRYVPISTEISGTVANCSLCSHFPNYHCWV